MHLLRKHCPGWVLLRWLWTKFTWGEPDNTYSATSRANFSSTSLPCPLNSGSSAGSASCQCNTGTSSPSGSPSDCTYCLPGSYQNLVGATSCLQCPYGKYSKTTGADMVENCAGCSETLIQQCFQREWDCLTGHRKNGNTCESTAPPPPPPQSPQPTSVSGPTPSPLTTRQGNIQTTQKQPSQYTHNPATNTALLKHIIIHNHISGCSIRRGWSVCGRGCGCLHVLATSTSC